MNTINIIKYQLNDGEYIKEKYKKNKIYLHHTAGSHRPDWVINFWNSDKDKNNNRLRIGTAYVIGGIGLDGNTEWDGKILQAFDDEYWAYHLGINKSIIDKESIGIEICNWGPLVKSTKDNNFYTYTNQKVPKEYVYELEQPWRGYKYFFKYTENQIKSLYQLLIHLINKYNIKNINSSLCGQLKTSNNIYNIFDIQNNALNNNEGIWTHCNVRRDKTDCYPNKLLIEMLKNI